MSRRRKRGRGLPLLGGVGECWKVGGYVREIDVVQW